MRTIGLLLIGNELLSGKVVDCHAHLICREAHAIGWRVAKVSGVTSPCALLLEEGIARVRRPLALQGDQLHGLTEVRTPC